MTSDEIHPFEIELEKKIWSIRDEEDVGERRYVG
jgi:hypothetical protein